MAYTISADKTGEIARWVCHGLQMDSQWLQENITFGFYWNNRLVGGLIFHDIRPGQDLWWTIYSTDKHWCNRRMLRLMFGLAFEIFQCRRINLLVSKSNSSCLNFVEKLGFKREGLLRSFRENGEDCYFLGMLKQECQWIKLKEKKDE